MFVLLVTYNLHQSTDNALFRLLTGVDLNACDIFEQLAQIMYLGASTGNVNTGMDNIFCKLRWIFSKIILMELQILFKLSLIAS